MDRDRGSSDELSLIALKTLIAAAFGLAVALVLYWYVPFVDPIETVGPPLLFGYSEAAEQWALYGFWAAIIVAALAVSRLRWNAGSPVVVFTGSLALLLLVLTPALARSPVPMLGFVLAWVGAYLCGGTISAILERSIGPFHLPWLGVLVWCGGYHDGGL